MIRRTTLSTFLLAAAAFWLGGAGPATRPATAPVKPRPDVADAFFNNGHLPRLRIDVDPKELRKLNDRPRNASGHGALDVRAIVRESAPGRPDVVYCDVALHLKGGPGSFRKAEDRPALTLNFDKFVRGQSFHGLDKVYLNNSVQDGSYLCEHLGSHIFREAGVPAPRVSNARVWLNGRDLGAYVLKEGFDGPFFKKYFREKDGNLYEGSFTDVNGNLPVHFGDQPDPPTNPLDKAQVKAHEAAVAAQRKASELRWRQLAEAAGEPDPVKRRARLEAVLDVDRFLTFLACETFTAHWDGYGGNRNNYRVFDDPRTDRFVFLPHGMDQLFQRPDYPLYANGAMVAAVLTQHPEDRQRFYDRMAHLRQTVFTPEGLTSHIEQRLARTLPLFEEISPDAARQHKGEAAGLRQRVIDRITGIDRQLANPPKPLKFDSSGVASLSGSVWETKLVQGEVVADKAVEAGKSRLRLTAAKAPGGNGSWRATVLLPQGRYAFEGSVKTVGVTAAKAENFGAGLRISGDKTLARLTGDNPWQTFRYEFEVAEALKEVVLVCDLNAEKGQAFFEPTSLKLRKR
jgi:hypothetical protein